MLKAHAGNMEMRKVLAEQLKEKQRHRELERQRLVEQDAKLKESIGAAKATVDEDVNACLEKLTGLERDVALLRKVLETSNAALNVQMPRAKAQMVEVLLTLSGKLVHGADAEHYQKFRAVHEFMDETQPKTLTEKFQLAVIKPLEQWGSALA